MKQHITREQFNELSQEAKEKLYTSLFPNEIEDNNRKILGFTSVIDINNKYITIGRLIEFLSVNDTYGVGTLNRVQVNDWVLNFVDEDMSFPCDGIAFDKEKLLNPCDVLWNEAKKILEKE